MLGFRRNLRDRPSLIRPKTEVRASSERRASTATNGAYAGVESAVVRKREFHAFLFAIVVLLWVANVPSHDALAQALYDTPVKYPATGNYYELVRAEPGHSLRGPGTAALGWYKAMQLATKRVYKGAPGRLAVVNSTELSNFLRRTFRADEKAWIGLRYWCRFNKLQWITGEFLKPGDFTNWDPQWYHDGGIHGGTKRPHCAGKASEYWPVHYWPVVDGFGWNANGQRKEARSYFVEYLTGLK